MSADQPGIDPDVLELARGEAGDCLERIERNLLNLERGEAGEDAIDALFRDAHSIKGSASMVGWKEAAALAHAIEDRLSEVRERGVFPAGLADPLLRATDVLKRAIAGESGLTKDAIAELSGSEEGTADVESPTESTADDESGPPADSTRPVATATEAAEGEGSGARPESRYMRVPAEKVDRILDAVGETALHHGRLEHLLGGRIDDATEEELNQGARLLDEFQESVIEMRTLPLSTITAPFARAVRDLAIAEGREVELKMSGTETQLDRLILDGISETIVHLLRNAVAHGIEPPEERERTGKPRTGLLQLRAEQRSGMVAIEVADDGRGVPAELLEKAEGPVSLADVVATPGLSTADRVSDTAGRGVGLDAVKRHVEGLGGSLEVRSEPGQGTVVVLLLPLTLALLQVLLCERGGAILGIPVASVDEVVSGGRTVSLEGRAALELRGEAIPFGDLAQVIGAQAPGLPDRAPAVVLRSAGRSAAVACDAVIGDRDVIVKTLGPALAGVVGYLGAAILGDGRVALILDPNHLLRMRPGRAAEARPPEVAEETQEMPRLLVVDDQFTVRELQRSILETAGYRVAVARNGVEALEVIGEEAGVDLVLTDISMPEMDGLELLRRIRADDLHESLPVVVVTSIGAEDDRRRGLDEGADAYIVKDQFDQQALLETIERLVGR